MLSGGQPSYRRYRAPRYDNAALVAPPIDELQVTPPCPSMALAFGDTSLAALRDAARGELLTAARSYTASYRDLPMLPASEAAFYLTGHQAELFHPGVWFKNFMLSRLAGERGAVAIHLVIDTDVMHSASVRVPTGSADDPTVAAVPLDALAPRLPVEERVVVDPQLFASFGQRAQQTIEPLVANPLAREWWPSVVEAARRTEGNLGLAIAQARHGLEAQWSATTLEVPMSHCCELPSFRQFVAALLLEPRRVRQAYNESLAAYRQAHRLRSSAQPMPSLSAEGDWMEVPLWTWTTDRPLREPLFARWTASRLTLSDRQKWHASLDLPAESAYEAIVEWLQDLAASGVKIRTRALTTTLFARLVLSDLFLHGIGGAKYDEVTDDLARRLWGCPPPPYLTLSATLQLPIEHQHVGEQELQRVRQNLRDCQWHPERFVDERPPPAVAEALASKRKWVATAKTSENASARHQAIEAANATLRAAVRQQHAGLEHREQRLLHQARATAILESREYAFCLYPQEDLRRRMWQLVQAG